MRVRFLVIAVAVLLWGTATAPRGQSTPYLQFIFTSDAHYGITRDTFRGRMNVAAHVVNEAMLDGMNSLSRTRFPRDGGLRSAEAVGPIDFVAQGGDIANREEDLGEGPIQPAAASIAQFWADYAEGLHLTDGAGRPTPLYVVPGNHDATNAVGFYKAMTPPVDKTAMVDIYNRMMAPVRPKTTTTFDFARDKVLFSRDIGGLHFVFVTVWPDSVGRAWIERDLEHVDASTPVIIFAHDQPDAEAKHFINPNGTHDINATDRFENLLSDQLADGPTIDLASTIEQTALERFVQRHTNITAYFHGNSNWNQFYDWTGPDHAIALHTFRVDSPMKGAVSSRDERTLSFQVVTIDRAARTMTVRECLWNADPTHPEAPLAWGASTTVALFPRP